MGGKKKREKDRRWWGYPLGDLEKLKREKSEINVQTFKDHNSPLRTQGLHNLHNLPQHTMANQALVQKFEQEAQEFRSLEKGMKREKG